MSPLSLEISNGSLGSLDVHASHMAGNIEISSTTIQNANITTKSSAILSNVTIRGNLTIAQPQSLQIVNSYVNT